METLKDGDTVSKVLDKSGEIYKELGLAKGQFPITKAAQKIIRRKKYSKNWPGYLHTNKKERIQN